MSLLEAWIVKLLDNEFNFFNSYVVELNSSILDLWKPEINMLRISGLAIVNIQEKRSNFYSLTYQLTIYRKNTKAYLANNLHP